MIRPIFSFWFTRLFLFPTSSKKTHLAPKKKKDMTSTSQLTSAEGLISLLDEEPDTQVFAVGKLDSVVNEFWPEIADSIGKIERLVEDKQFASRKAAALLASKVFYHLEQYKQSMSFALEAEELFDVTQGNEYVDTLIGTSLTKSISQINCLPSTHIDL